LEGGVAARLLSAVEGVEGAHLHSARKLLELSAFSAARARILNEVRGKESCSYS